MKNGTKSSNFSGYFELDRSPAIKRTGKYSRTSEVATDRWACSMVRYGGRRIVEPFLRIFFSNIHRPEVSTGSKDFAKRKRTAFRNKIITSVLQVLISQKY
jgi:hypothetical protein